MTGPGRFASRLLSRSWLSRDTFELQLERPADFRFHSGQGIRISYGAGEREYTLVNGPEDGHLAVCVQRVEKGAVSPALASLEPGSTLVISGPHGYFTFQEGGAPCVFVGTGTGIAPFVSMARSGIRGFSLLQGAATQTDLHYRQVVQPAAKEYVGCLSREAVGPSSPAWTFAGRVTEFLKARLPPGPFDFYACGRGEMVRDVISLVDERFPGSRVFFEIFF